MEEVTADSQVNPVAHIAITGFKLLFVATSAYIGYKMANDKFDETIGKQLEAKFQVPTIES